MKLERLHQHTPLVKSSIRDCKYGLRSKSRIFQRTSGGYTIILWSFPWLCEKRVSEPNTVCRNFGHDIFLWRNKSTEHCCIMPQFATLFGRELLFRVATRHASSLHHELFHHIRLFNVTAPVTRKAGVASRLHTCISMLNSTRIEYRPHIERKERSPAAHISKTGMLEYYEESL